MNSGTNVMVTGFGLAIEAAITHAAPI